MGRHWILAVGLVVIFLEAAGAQAPTSTAQQAAPGPTFVNLSRVSNDYQIGPGDLLDIQVVGQNTLNQVLRVSNSGEISFSSIGLICVADLTAFDIENTIAQRLRQKNLIQQPEVLVSITEYQAKPIYVSGAVVNPGQFVMSQELTAAEAILLSGGLQFNAANEGYVQRRVSAEGGSGSAGPCGVSRPAVTPAMQMIKVDLQPLKEGRFFEAALPLKRGDVLVVPEMHVNPFFVVGEVISPSNYFYPPGQTLMASQAISYAGGPTATAKMSQGMLVRYDERGNRKELKVDYAAILRGNQPDFAVQPNDIIFIPGSAVKTITQGLIGMTDTMVMQQAFHVARMYQLPEPPQRPAREPR